MSESGLIKSFYSEVMGKGDFAFLEEVVSEDLVDHEDPLPGQPPGLEGVKFFVTAIRDAFPDIQPKSVEPMLADGDMEAALSVLTGTHKGDFMGVPATGRTVEIKGMDIIRVKDGKVVEHWGLTDSMGLMQQLGALPE
jgi:steroid delta-isomerase-like uncharacterized protein